MVSIALIFHNELLEEIRRTYMRVSAADKVGMYAINCPEWMLVLQACNRNTHYCGESLTQLLHRLKTCTECK